MHDVIGIVHVSMNRRKLANRLETGCLVGGHGGGGTTPTMPLECYTIRARPPVLVRTRCLSIVCADPLRCLGEAIHLYRGKACVACTIEIASVNTAWKYLGLQCREKTGGGARARERDREREVERGSERASERESTVTLPYP